MRTRLPVSHDGTVLSVSAARLQMRPTLKHSKTISKSIYYVIFFREMIAKSCFVEFIKCTFASCWINHGTLAELEDTIPPFTTCIYST